MTDHARNIEHRERLSVQATSEIKNNRICKFNILEIAEKIFYIGLMLQATRNLYPIIFHIFQFAQRHVISNSGLNRRDAQPQITTCEPRLRWKRMPDSGEFATIAELAEREGIAPPYKNRVLRLTLLARDIVEGILDGRQQPELTLARVMGPFPA